MNILEIMSDQGGRDGVDGGGMELKEGTATNSAERGGGPNEYTVGNHLIEVQNQQGKEFESQVSQLMSFERTQEQRRSERDKVVVNSQGFKQIVKEKNVTAPRDRESLNKDLRVLKTNSLPEQLFKNQKSLEEASDHHCCDPFGYFSSIGEKMKRWKGRVPVTNYTIGQDGNPLLTRTQEKPILAKHDPQELPIFGFQLDSHVQD